MELLLYTQEYYIIHLEVVSNLYVVNKLFITLQAFAWVMSEWGYREQCSFNLDLWWNVIQVSQKRYYHTVHT